MKSIFISGAIPRSDVVRYNDMIHTDMQISNS